MQPSEDRPAAGGHLEPVVVARHDVLLHVEADAALRPDIVAEIVAVDDHAAVHGLHVLRRSGDGEQRQEYGRQRDPGCKFPHGVSLCS